MFSQRKNCKKGIILKHNKYNNQNLCIMKKIILTLILLALTSFIYAQDWSSDIYSVGQKYPGYIIKTTGEKIEGYIEAQPRGEKQDLGNSNQTRVIFYTDKDDKKSKVIYKPEDVKEYMVADKVYRSIYYSGGLTSKVLRFVLRVKEGCIASYVWYNCKQYYINTGDCDWEEVQLYQKGEDKPVEQSSFALNFAKKMSEYVSDHAELSAKILNKEKGYGMLKLLEIIDEYNTWCAENNK